MTIIFLQLTRNNMIGSEILFLLMLKFQRKNYHCLLKKNFLELRNDRTLRLTFRDITLDEFWIAVGKECRKFRKKTLEILLQ